MRLLGLCALSASAWATPIQLTHQGRLLDGNGAPLSAQVTVQIGLFVDGSTATPLWTEGHDLTPDDGYFTVVLGADTVLNPLDDSLFDGSPRYVEVSVSPGGACVVRNLQESTSPQFLVAAFPTPLHRRA